MKTGKLCRRPGVKWHASGKPLILPTVAGIMMIVLFFTECASTRKSRTEVNRNSSLSSSADNVSNVRRGLLMTGIPKSAVSLMIPPDSLRKLPSGSSYHSRNGQAGLTVKSDATGNIIAEASCDSLQRLVLCYEEELTRIRNETHEDSFTVETEFERRFSPVKIALAAFITGCVAGIVLTFKIKKQ